MNIFYKIVLGSILLSTAPNVFAWECSENQGVQESYDRNFGERAGYQARKAIARSHRDAYNVDRRNARRSGKSISAKDNAKRTLEYSLYGSAVDFAASRFDAVINPRVNQQEQHYRSNDCVRYVKSANGQSAFKRINPLGFVSRQSNDARHPSNFFD